MCTWIYVRETNNAICYGLKINLTSIINFTTNIMPTTSLDKVTTVKSPEKRKLKQAEELIFITLGRDR